MLFVMELKHKYMMIDQPGFNKLEWDNFTYEKI